MDTNYILINICYSDRYYLTVHKISLYFINNVNYTLRIFFLFNNWWVSKSNIWISSNKYNIKPNYVLHKQVKVSKQFTILKNCLFSMKLSTIYLAIAGVL